MPCVLTMHSFQVGIGRKYVVQLAAIGNILSEDNFLCVFEYFVLAIYIYIIWLIFVYGSTEHMWMYEDMRCDRFKGILC